MNARQDVDQAGPLCHAQGCLFPFMLKIKPNLHIAKGRAEMGKVR